MIKNPKNNYLTSTEAANLSGFSTDHVRNLIRRGKLKGEKLGRIWVIHDKELSKVKRQRNRFTKSKETYLNGSNE